MPIVVKDYTWEQTETETIITIPLKGVKTNKVDITLTDEYLKVNYPPYFFETLLYGLVDDKKSVANVGNGIVLMRLTKQGSGLWQDLHSVDFGNKEAMKQKREEAIQKMQEKSELMEKDRAEKKRAAEKYALNKQMNIEQDERKRIENQKQQERDQATRDLESWKEQQIQEAEKEKLKLLEEKKVMEEKQAQEKEREKQLEGKKKTKKKKDIFAVDGEGHNVRQTGQIKINFTPRVFPTAARESTKDKEEEWLKKQAEARKIANLEDSDLKEEEKNPVWLRDKGIQFFQSGNYHAAVNAFTHAIRLDSKLPSLYSNRSACHLKLANYIKAAEDSAKALELLTPPVPQNVASRVKAHIRRGTAFCQLELYVEGLQDYDAALKIDPKNEQLKMDADKIRIIIQSSTVIGNS